MRYLFCLLFFFIGGLVPATAQFYKIPAYPKGYFRNPLSIPINLSGNFGELRNNHYHMGLDLKTNARENLPVYAAADGYISRIKIEPAGFGRAIYITHPNGLTTLYAHLNDFNPRIEAYLKQAQYAQESWKVFLELTPDELPVKKGDFLAYSGNTGGSQAPHLHFEIRTADTDVNLNPLLFGFDLADNTLPRILRLAIYDRNQSVFEQSPRLIPIKSTGTGRYASVAPLITVGSPKISLALTTYDTHSGSSNLNGVLESGLWMDEKPMIAFRMDSISYNDTRYLNAHIDYRMKSAGGTWLQHLSELPGYISSIYIKKSGNGILDLSDRQIHDLRIVVRDAYGNASELRTQVQWNGNAPAAVSTPAGQKRFYPLMLDGFESEECEFYIGERCLYDAVNIRYQQLPAGPQAVSALHAIGASTIPLQEAFLIRIQPNRTLNPAQKNRTVMQWYAGAKKDVQKVEWQQGWGAARFRDFGYYQLLVDEEPPQIVPIGFTDGSNLSKATRIAFTIKDNLEKFKNVRTELDGRWIRFSNDKGRTFIYRFDEKCMSGNHVLKISAEDEAGNRVEKEWSFVR